MKKPTKEQLAADISTDMTWQDIADKYGYTDPRFLRKLRIRWGLPQRRNFLKPSKEALCKMITEDRLTPYQVATNLGYAENGWSLIYRYCREYGIPVDFKPHYHARQRPITDEQKSIIFGTMLGDGYINPNGFMVIAHGLKQIDYLEWKKDKLMPYMVDKIKHMPNKSGYPYSVHGTYYYSSIAHPWLKLLRGFMYPCEKKTITTHWLNEIDPLALAVWYMDDGSLNTKYGTIVFCTMSCSVYEMNLLKRWFLEKWGIETVIENRRNHRQVLRINASYRNKLFKIIKPHVPYCMSYKTDY